MEKYELIYPITAHFFNILSTFTVIKYSLIHILKIKTHRKMLNKLDRGM